MENIEVRVASIIIPSANDDGDIFVTVQQNVVEMFIEHFGGATLYECNGFWSMSDRTIHCVKIDVAIDTMPETIKRFMDIVKWVANECQVHSIMAVKPDGVVVFVEGDLYDGTKNV